MEGTIPPRRHTFPEEIVPQSSRLLTRIRQDCAHGLDEIYIFLALTELPHGPVQDQQVEFWKSIQHQPEQLGGVEGFARLCMLDT